MDKEIKLQSKWLEKCVRDYLELGEDEPITKELLGTIKYLYITTAHKYEIAFGKGDLPKEFYFDDVGDEWGGCCISNPGRYSRLYKIIGYYICEIDNLPKWLGNISDRILSVTGCFGDIYPDLEYCFFLNNLKKQRKEYRKKLKLSDEKISLLEAEIGEMFEKTLAIDGRFLQLSDAQHFYDTYFYNVDCVIVSVSTTKEYFEILKSELQNNSNSKADNMNGEIDGNELIGYDILGWDISGFHSFLCNSLHERLSKVSFNEYALLNNTFDEVVEFSKQIKGQGEPVEWIPCRIGKV